MSSLGSALAGWATVEFTPQPPCWMGGYGARTAPAASVHDPLYAHAFALGTSTSPLILIACDLIEVDDDLVRAIRHEVRVALPDATVWVSATHTHSGPAITRLPPLATHPVDETVISRIITACARAAAEAARGMRAVRYAWASGAIEGVGTNRDHPDTPAAITLDMLCCYASDNTAGMDHPDAVFASFPCHPTVLGAENLAITADLPGAFRRQVKMLLGERTWVALATGAAGDISTRYTRQAQSFEELERLGGVLAHQAKQLIATAHPIAVTDPVIARETIQLERKEVPSPETLDANERALREQMESARAAGKRGEARTLETALQGVHAVRLLAAAPPADDVWVEITAAHAGELRLAGVPGELFNRLGADIRQAGTTPTLLLGYTNGYVGYLPTCEAYDRLDYEVLISPLARGSGERVRDAACTLLGMPGGARS